MESPKLIAEIGCNHRGDFSIACEMIRALAGCGIEVAKFQKRCPRELLTEEQYNAPHPDPESSYGETYGEHRERLEFSIEEHALLKELCEEAGIQYHCSVWDLTSTREIISLQPAWIKIPSAMNNHRQLLELILSQFAGQIHISLGMTTLPERRELFSIIHSSGREKDVVLYACTSAYPAAMKDLCLLDIRAIADSGFTPGFSNHQRKLTSDIAAFTLGAQYIEKHFTLDRSWKGTDQKQSLEPAEIAQLRFDLEEIALALQYRPDMILECEWPQRKKLKWQTSE